MNNNPENIELTCNNCNLLENESELIETFDNQLLCSPCYIKKELNTESEATNE